MMLRLNGMAGNESKSTAGLFVLNNGNRDIAYVETLEAAKLIKHVIGCHEDLVAALEACLPQVEFTHAYQQRTMTAAEANHVAAVLEQARAALAKAKEG